MNTLQYFDFFKMNNVDGFPIIVPCKDKEWKETVLYPNKDGLIWRFVKTN